MEKFEKKIQTIGKAAIVKIFFSCQIEHGFLNENIFTKTSVRFFLHIFIEKKLHEVDEIGFAFFLYLTRISERNRKILNSFITTEIHSFVWNDKLPKQHFLWFLLQIFKLLVSRNIRMKILNLYKKSMSLSWDSNSRLHLFVVKKWMLVA